MIPRCHQCQTEMEHSLEMEKKLVFVCVQPGCSNYGVLQVAAEQIEKAKDGN